MHKIGMFEAKTHLPKIIQEVQKGGEVCLTNRNQEVAFIISAEQYYQKKQGDAFKRLEELRRKSPIGSVEDILRMRDEGRK